MSEPERVLVSVPLLDERGRACPAPIIAVARGLKAHPVVELWADDPAVEGDLRAFLEATGQVLLELRPGVPFRAIVGRKGSP